MTISEDQSRPMFAVQSPGNRRLFQSLKAAAVWLSEWFDSCADHYAAARMYESLSRLSDAQLEHRGLSRATLAQDLFRMCDRTSETDTATMQIARIKSGHAPRIRAKHSALALAWIISTGDRHESGAKHGRPPG